MKPRKDAIVSNIIIWCNEKIAQCNSYCLGDNIAKENTCNIDIADTCLAMFAIYCNIAQPQI